jgi:hypothetical protein
MHHFAAFPASYLVCALQITYLYLKKDGYCRVELRCGDLRLIRFIAKLKELKTEITRVIDCELIFVSGLLNEALEQMSKMVPARAD